MTAPIIAAKWWADQLLEAPEHDNGERAQSAFATIIARRLQPVTSYQYNTFRNALEKAIEQKLEDEKAHVEMLRVKYPESRSNHLPAQIQVSTDYDPDRTLQTALDAAGITQGSLRFPIKTIMWINPGEVKVACGYRAPIETIWEAGQDASTETKA